MTIFPVNFIPHIPLADNNELYKNEKNLLTETIKNKNPIEKAVKNSLVEDKTQNNDIKRRNNPTKTFYQKAKHGKIWRKKI